MPGRSTSQAFDLVFEDPDDPEHPIGVMLARPDRRPLVLQEVFEPTELGAISPPRPVPVVWNTWTGGAGVARPIEGVRGAFTIARNACTRFGRSVTPAGGLHEISLAGLSLPPGRINGFAPYGSDVVVLTDDNRPLLIREHGAGIVQQATTLLPGWRSEDATVFAGWLYIGSTAPNLDFVRFNATSGWQQLNTSGTLRRQRIATTSWTRGGVPRRRMIAMGPDGGLMWTTGDEPFNADHWSSEVPLETPYGLQRLLAAPRHVYGIGPGGVSDLTENGETPLITGDSWVKNYDPSNGANGVLYDGDLYLAGANGVARIGLEGRLVDVSENVSLGHLQPAEIPVGGRPRALFTVDGWLCMVTHTDATVTSQLWYGMRRERTGAVTPWPFTWHGSECDLVGQDVTAACVVSPPGRPRRILFGTLDTTTGATRLWWHTLARYGSPIQDYRFGGEADRMDYARDWAITFTDEDLGDPASTKDPLWWEVLGKHLGGPNSLTIEAANRDGAWVTQGTATMGYDRFGAHGVRDTTLSVRVTGANSETVPALLEAVKGSWVVTVEESATVAVPLVFGQGVPLLNGDEDAVDAAVTFARLVHLTRFSSVMATRWDGARVRVRVEQGIRRRWQEPDNGQGWLAGAELNITILSRPMIHDVGDLHDVGLRHDF